MKAERALRAQRPEARIIHELVLTQGGERIDIAAVWPDGIILAEVKSEKDVLKRLPGQLRAALALGCEVWLCAAPKWREHVEAMSSHQSHEKVELRNKSGIVIGSTYKTNPAYIGEISNVVLAWEKDDGFEWENTWRQRPYPPADGVAMLDMLWAEELRAISGTHHTDTRTKCMNAAREFMTGQQVRRAACAALMARAFPRADPPIGDAVSTARGLFTKQAKQMKLAEAQPCPSSAAAGEPK